MGETRTSKQTYHYQDGRDVSNGAWNAHRQQRARASVHHVKLRLALKKRKLVQGLLTHTVATELILDRWAGEERHGEGRRLLSEGGWY